MISAAEPSSIDPDPLRPDHTDPKLQCDMETSVTASNLIPNINPETGPQQDITDTEPSGTTVPLF